MATVPTPRTWTVGELLTAAKLNQDLRDGLNFLLAPPVAHLRRTAAQSIPTGVATNVAWTTEITDTDIGHDNVTNNTRYTAKTAGWFDCNATVSWALNSTGIRNVYFFKNSSTSSWPTVTIPAGGGYAYSKIVGAIFLSVNDYLEVQGFQDSGVALNLDFGGTDVFYGWRSI